MCEYEYRNGEKCHREALENSEKSYCLLHEDWDNKDEEEIREQFYKEISEGETNFEGCVLPGFDLSSRVIKDGVNMINAIIHGDATFGRGVSIKGDVHLRKVEIKGKAIFTNGTIEGSMRLDNAKIEGYISLEKAKVKGHIYFEDAVINEIAYVEEAEIQGAALFCKSKMDEARFQKATIEGNLSFWKAMVGKNASFKDAKLNGNVVLKIKEISSLTFKNTRFRKMSAQENACREAKIVNERRGDRELADYHFYREMEAKRKLKYKKFSFEKVSDWLRKFKLTKVADKYVKWFERERRMYWGFWEWPIQYIFGYGVYPRKIIVSWFLAVFGFFPLIFWLGHGVKKANSFWQSLYFSIVTATTLGYGDFQPTPGVFRTLASAEAIFGTLMWAAFIAIFARKYMR